LVTISNNDAFTALLDGCGFNTFNEDLTASYCFDIVFPISVYDNNQQQVTINSYQEFLAYMSGPAGVELQVIFPISVVMNNQTVVVDNIYEFYQDRKSTRLNSSHVKISYAVFCLKQKTTQTQ